MKKMISIILVTIMLVTVCFSNYATQAQEYAPEPGFKVDGIKDSYYRDDFSFTVLDTYINNQNPYNPEDPDRVTLKVWYAWDDDYIYLYELAGSKDPLVKTEAEKKALADWFETISLWIDPNPSVRTFPNEFNKSCESTDDGDVMVRYSPYNGNVYNYYGGDAHMFLTEEQFVTKFSATKGWTADDYYNRGGGVKYFSPFVDFDANTYGFEMRIPRYEGESSFCFNTCISARPKTFYEGTAQEFIEQTYALAIGPLWWMSYNGVLSIPYSLHPDSFVPSSSSTTPDSSDSPVSSTISDSSASSDPLISSGGSDYLLGDVNNDGKINTTDALLALRIAVNKITPTDLQKTAADYNKDGTVNTTDALQILRVAVGK